MSEIKFLPTIADQSIRDIVAENIRTLRLERRWSQDVLGVLAGFGNRTYISSIERKVHNVGIDSIERIANAFDVPIARLFQR